MLKTKFESFNDGVVDLHKVTDLALPGDLPVEGLVLKQTLRYKERTVGLNRYYEALQHDIKVDYVIRCPEVRGLSEKATDILVAILIDGQQYAVKLCGCKRRFKIDRDNSPWYGVPRLEGRGDNGLYSRGYTKSVTA